MDYINLDSVTFIKCHLHSLLSSVSRCATFAVVLIDHIIAVAMDARVGFTFIYLHFTVDSSVTRLTSTDVFVDHIITTAIEARI